MHAETDEKPAAEEEATGQVNGLADKRGRMVAAGVIAAVILSGIAVLVAGIMEISGRGSAKGPQELSVNDPAPILWDVLTTDKGGTGTLGVPGNLTAETALKSGAKGPK